jgi:hypothetical protein
MPKNKKLNQANFDDENTRFGLTEGSKVMNDQDGFKFTCKDCGSHNLIVTHIWNTLAGPNSEHWQEWGPLKDNHHWQYEFREKIEDDGEDHVQRGDFGGYEEDDASSEPEEYEVYETENDKENDEYFINCASCDREIEFGWSKPDRHGLIWPVECSDFVPVDIWPDPKYTESWQQKKWFPTGNTKS